MEIEENVIWDCLGAEAPKADGLYDPSLEKEACGVGFVVQIDGIRSNKVKIFGREKVYDIFVQVKIK